MARILVLYGTSDGHTEKIAAAIASALSGSGCDADVVKAGTVDPAIGMYDGVIVAASLRAGSFQQAVIDCVRAHAHEIASKPNVFVPVCLAVLNRHDPTVDAELKRVVAQFAAACGWQPAQTHFVAGALPYTRYNFVTRWMMKRIVAKAGGDTDTSRDYIYTDWGDLEAFAVEFGRRLTAAAV
jgi:menaquinone-dependent protoporphyrinogen oxidase